MSSTELVPWRTDRNDPLKLDAASSLAHERCLQLRCNALYPSSLRYNLTISHAHKFIWFRVAKVATRTILHHLRRYAGPLDVDHAMQIHYPLNLCRDYFKFAFVRNPWERLASCWRNKVVDGNYFGFDAPTRQQLCDFERFVEFVGSLDVQTCDHHLRLQCRLIDLNQIDFLGRLETFDRDFMEICRRINIPCEQVQHHNKSKANEGNRELYSPKLIELAADFYRKDVQIFGYGM